MTPRMATIKRALLISLTVFLSGQLALAEPQPAASPAPKEVAKEQIPTKPSAPPSLVHPMPKELFGCRRDFIYRGKPVQCDSNLSQDAENLRPVIQDVPAAVRELDVYQSNRRHVQNLAYVGSVGLLSAALGLLIFRNINGLNTVAIRNVSILGGSAIMVGTALYGLAILKSNDSHLENAVQNYNAARPKDPVELKFSTGITF